MQETIPSEELLYNRRRYNFVFFLVTSELIILSLELVKTRVVVMGVEMRKAFIGSVLMSMVEKSLDIKIMKAVVKVNLLVRSRVVVLN